MKPFLENGTWYHWRQSESKSRYIPYWEEPEIGHLATDFHPSYVFAVFLNWTVFIGLKFQILTCGCGYAFFLPNRVAKRPGNDSHESSLYLQYWFLLTLSWPPLHWSSPIFYCVSKVLWEGLTGIIYPFRRCSNAQIRPRFITNKGHWDF